MQTYKVSDSSVCHVTNCAQAWVLLLAWFVMVVYQYLVGETFLWVTCQLQQQLGMKELLWC